MIEVSLEQKDALLSLSGRELLPKSMSKENFELIERLLPVLKLFDDETRRVKFYFYNIL